MWLNHRSPCTEAAYHIWIKHRDSCWLVGIAVAHCVHPRSIVIGLLAVLPLAGLVLWQDSPEVRRVASCGILLLGPALFTLSLRDLANPGHGVATTDRGSVTARARVTGEPVVPNACTHLRLAVDRVQIQDEEYLVKGAILARSLF